MRNVNITKSSKPLATNPELLKRCDRYLNVYDRLGAQPGNCSRSIMVDAYSQWSKHSGNSISLRFKGSWLIRIVRD
jgi:hypothetical protein